MKTIPHLGKFLAVFVLTLFVIACSKNDDDANPGTDDEIGNTDDDVTPPLPNIVELAQSVDVLTTLLDAIDAADPTIADVLSGDGPFTVFAPTNDAFNDLLNQLDDFADLDDFDEDAEKELLAQILQYHVISGTEAFSTSLSDGTVLTTLQTEELTINVDGAVFVQDQTEDLAEVVGADNDASNGVVHIIDKVLLPQAALDALFPKPSIVELVVETEELSLLEEAVIKANLVDALNAEGPFTVFAPTNAAIEELFDLLGDSFTSFDDFDNFIELQILEQILLYHVVPGNVASSELTPGTVNTLLENETLEIIGSGNTFVIGDASDVDANILTPDQEASNGIVHIIDKILIPQEIQDFLDTINPDDPDATLPTIREIVESTDELNFLREALELTGLLETLGEEGPFTVFAPTNETITMLFALIGGSFGDLDEFNLDFEIDLLRQVLSYHVVQALSRLK
ncbi:MAG: fasciclin domain-containing protein [Bacteroidota bacterium]